MTSYKRPPVIETGFRLLVENIDNYHEKFCMLDDPEKKSEALRLLKGYATDYLNKVTHSAKFQIHSLERVLTQSVQSKVEFDPREAGSAFEHLAKYAQNLLEQPWRDEFKTIHLSSGYYVHNIQHYLHNPHEILISMGYTNIDDSTLQLATSPNSHELKKISRDCFLASQECLILGQILDYVQTDTKQGGIPAAQVYAYRKEYVGDVTTVGRKICFDIREQQHNEKQKMMLYQQNQARQYQQQQQLDNRMEVDCPVGCLVDVDESCVKGMKVVGDIPEREMVQKILRNTEREQEHIYDPVSVDDPILSTTSKYQMNSGGGGSNMHNLSPSSPSINSSSSNFIYPSEHSAFARNFNNNNNYIPSSYSHPPPQSDFGLPDPEQQHQKNWEQRYYNSPTRSSTASPYIPQTISHFTHPEQQSNTTNNSVSDGDYNRRHYNSSSSSSGGLPYPPITNSSSSNSTKLAQQNVALQKHKISQDELYRMTTTTDNNKRQSDKADWAEKQLQQSLHQQQQQFDASSKSRSRQPLGVYSQNSNSAHSMRESTSTSLDDSSVMLQQALQYKNEVNSLAVKSRKSTSALEPTSSSSVSSQPYHLHHREPKEEKEMGGFISSGQRKSSDSERESGGNKSSASVSSEASSWGYSNYADHNNIDSTTMPKPTTFTDGGVVSRKKSFDCCDSASVPVESEYRSSSKNPVVVGSTSLSSSTKSPPTETNLDSLETVYYKQLQSQMVTDQSHENYYHHPQHPISTSDENLSSQQPILYLSSKDNQILPVKRNSTACGLKETNLDGDPPPFISSGEFDNHNNKASSYKSSQSKKDVNFTSSSSPPPPPTSGQQQVIKEKKGKERQRQPEENEIPSSSNSNHINPVKKAHQPRWQCPHCTFINHTTEKICEMCCKSQDFIVDEDSEPEQALPNPHLPKLYSTTTPGIGNYQDNTKKKKNGSSAHAVKDGSPPSSQTKDNTIKSESSGVGAEDTIACPQCTVLNPKCRFECDCCGHRLKNLKD